MAKKNKIAITLSILLLLTIGVNFVSPVSIYGIRYNSSESLPYCLFLSKKSQGMHLDYGTIIAFNHATNQLPLAKKITGLPGDIIDISNTHIYVRGEDLGEIKTISPSGYRLTPLTERIVPEGYLFVSGKHELSFDSRYAEFGLVPMDTVQEVLWPVF
jgi:conjugal transfer pilin signal peptidase TrbI